MAQIIFPLEIARQGRGGGGAVLRSFQRTPQTCFRYFPLCGHKEKPFANLQWDKRRSFFSLASQPTGVGVGHPGSAAVGRVS